MICGFNHSGEARHGLSNIKFMGCISVDVMHRSGGLISGGGAAQARGAEIRPAHHANIGSVDCS